MCVVGVPYATTTLDSCITLYLKFKLRSKFPNVLGEYKYHSNPSNYTRY